MPYAYDPTLGDPVEWLKFLESLSWGEGTSQHRELRKWFGYFASGATDMQKLFLLVGPPRAGKGTIAHVLTALLGELGKVTSASLESFGKTFGMENLLDKSCLIIPDLREGRSTDLAAVTERMLTISGGDVVQIGRKYRPAWVGKLSCRVIIMTNAVPKLPDPSGAIATRFETLKMTKSFLHHEDTGLLDRLLPELPQILLWSLRGLRDLRAEGFIPQDNGLLDRIKTASTAMHEFVEDHLILDPDAQTFQDIVHQRYTEFCKDNGHRAMSHSRFKIALESMNTGVHEIRPYVNGQRGPRMWSGARLVDLMKQVRSPWDDAQAAD